MEEFSVGQMLPVVPINSDQKGNSLSDTSIEEMIDSNNEEFDKESDENNTLTKSINKVFDSLDLSTKKEECKDCENTKWLYRNKKRMSHFIWTEAISFDMVRQSIHRS